MTMTMTMTMTITTEQLSSTPDTTAGLQSVPVPDDTSCRAARQAIEAYGRRQSSGSEHNDLAVGAERVRAVTEQFAGNLLVDKEGRPLREVYDLALLCDVVDCLVDESCPDEDRTQAAVQIINYLTQPQLSGDGSEQPARPMLDQAHFDRTIQFMADLSVISQGVDHHRQAVLADIADEAQRRRLSQPGGEQSFGRLDPDDWRLPTRLISLEHLYKEIVKKTNLEALIPKAAVVLDRLRNPSADAVSTWHDCMEAETVYAPLCELLGLDGMAMDLRSQAIQLRLMGSSGGKPSSLEIAEQIYQELRKTDMQELLAHLFDEELAVQYSVGPAPDGEEQIIFGEARSDDIRMVFRIKSIGSLAEKLGRDSPQVDGRTGYNNQLPMDIIGMTVIVEDTAEVARRFEQLLTKVDQDPAVSLAPAPSKCKAAYIQGTQDYVEVMQHHLPDHISERIQYADKVKQYCVSKLTLFLDKDGLRLPVEVQFLTEGDREASRTGLTAHLLIKAADQQSAERRTFTLSDLIGYFKGINRRKKHLASAEVYPDSRGNVAPFMKTLLDHLDKADPEAIAALLTR